MASVLDLREFLEINNRCGPFHIWPLCEFPGGGQWLPVDGAECDVLNSLLIGGKSQEMKSCLRYKETCGSDFAAAARLGRFSLD
jgi:hypothetical protein